MIRLGNSCVVRDLASRFGRVLWWRDVAVAWARENDAKGKHISNEFGADDAAGQHVVINAPHSLPGFCKMPEKN